MSERQEKLHFPDLPEDVRINARKIRKVDMDGTPGDREDDNPTELLRRKQTTEMKGTERNAALKVGGLSDRLSRFKSQNAQTDDGPKAANRILNSRFARLRNLQKGDGSGKLGSKLGSRLGSRLGSGKLGLGNALNRARLGSNSGATKLGSPLTSSRGPTGRISKGSNLVENATGNVLLVEDLNVSQRVAIMALKRYKYSVTVVESGEASIEAFKKDSTFTLVLMDINLPGISGVEAVEIIRQFEQDEQRKPCTILGLTANAGEKDLSVYEAAGMNGCIKKGKLITRSISEAFESLKEDPKKFYCSV